MVVQLFWHIDEMEPATDQLALFEPTKTVAIIADTIDINGNSDMVGMETERRGQRNRFLILHIPFIYDSITRFYIRRNPEFRYTIYCREMHATKRNRPTVVEPYYKVVRIMPAHSVKTNNEQSDKDRGERCNEDFKKFLSFFQKHLSYNK